MESVPSGSYRVIVKETKTLVCQDPYMVSSEGIWLQNNPLNYATPLLLMQLSIISLLSVIANLCFLPLGQSTIVSQIIGGIIFGPSLLGHDKVLGSTLFPINGAVTMGVFATFGIMFFFFEIGVKMDASMMLRPGKLAMIIGLSVTIITLGLTTSVAILLKEYVPMDKSLASSLPLIAASQCLTAFPNIVCLLTELKTLNTDLGRLAVSTAMFCDVIGISLTAVGFASECTDIIRSIFAVLSVVALIFFVAYVFRPVLLWFQRHTTEAKFVGEKYITTIFTSVIVAGLAGEVIGQHYIFGPLVLGLAVPEGPPLGAALVTKLNSLVSGLLYPTFLTVSGLKTNVFKIHLQSAWIILFLVLFASLVKIGAVLLPAWYSNMPLREAVVVGLMLNARGICELVVYNLWRDGEMLTEQEFALAVISVIIVTGIITPLIRVLHNPSRNQLPIKRRTIQQAKRDTEFRILVCIQNEDNVPTIVNLLEVSNATEESPIAVIALLLVELVGRSTPMLIAHQPQQTPERNTSTYKSSQIINALHQYQLYNDGCVTIQSFSTISHLVTMHEDICRVAMDQNATIIIIPFHKRWAIDGNIESVNRANQNMNINVLDKAPCSVGILINRGILNSSLSIINSQSTYHVAVLYISGPDDRESLSYAARMANHENVTLTIIRYLLFGSDNARERKIDNDLINQLRHANVGNEAFSYEEEVVRDGVGLATSIRGLEDCFDLIIAGRHHQESPLFQGLGAWIECPELGVVGDILAAPDFGGTASVLVVQQQRVLAGKLMSHSPKSIVNDRDFPLQGRPSHAGSTASTTAGSGPGWTLSMEKSSMNSVLF